VAGAGVAVHGLVAVVWGGRGMLGFGDEEGGAVWHGLTLGALILVEHHHADGGAEGDAKLGARLDQHTVLFVTGGRDVALAGATAGHLGLDVVLGELHAGGDAVDDAADGTTVRLAIAVNSRLGIGGRRGGGGMGTYVWTRKYSPKVDMMAVLAVGCRKTPRKRS
jgi:hypothetical protein